MGDLITTGLEVVGLVLVALALGWAASLLFAPLGPLVAGGCLIATSALIQRRAPKKKGRT